MTGRDFEVQFLKAPLLIRVGIRGGSASLSARALTIDETRDLMRKLSYAVEEGQRYINELKEAPPADPFHIQGKFA